MSKMRWITLLDFEYEFMREYPDSESLMKPQKITETFEVDFGSKNLKEVQRRLTLTIKRFGEKAKVEESIDGGLLVYVTRKETEKERNVRVMQYKKDQTRYNEKTVARRADELGRLQQLADKLGYSIAEK